MLLSLHQAAERNSVSLGPDADRLHKHPHVVSGPALDARRLPTLALTRPSARQSGAARGERTPLHHVSVAGREKKTMFLLGAPASPTEQLSF